NPSQPPQPPQPSQPPAKPARQRPAITPFSTLELLTGAGFTGFEAGLLAIALVSLLGTTLISASFWLVILVGLILAQSRRIIERVDLAIIAGLTLALVLFIAPLRQMIVIPTAGNLLLSVVVIAVIGGLSAIALTALFRLIYKLLSSLF
ncbi:MAG: serine/threonine protein kinase, partial [Leptolyngbyaceae cyanobacterium RU_5_1]|nr:serine/threonine protein kinase [Leptolyngbyaceae cyanobacterium RU_5_1]